VIQDKDERAAFRAERAGAAMTKALTPPTWDDLPPGEKQAWLLGEALDRERISSAFVEATVNLVVSKRFAKKQQMQWTRRAHIFSCRPAPGRSTERCDRPSSAGIPDWPTKKRRRRHSKRSSMIAPHFLMVSTISGHPCDRSRLRHNAL
jgi:hypothetical protein